jgi:hypothetical protein
MDGRNFTIYIQSLIFRLPGYYRLPVSVYIDSFYFKTRDRQVDKHLI